MYGTYIVKKTLCIKTQKAVTSCNFGYMVVSQLTLFLIHVFFCLQMTCFPVNTSRNTPPRWGNLENIRHQLHGKLCDHVIIVISTQAQIGKWQKFQSAKPGLFGMIAPTRAQQTLSSLLQKIIPSNSYFLSRGIGCLSLNVNLERIASHNLSRFSICKSIYAAHRALLYI